MNGTAYIIKCISCLYQRKIIYILKLSVFSAAGRPAFEVIDSVVNAVGSVSMLLDSTHATVFSLFRSVIGVADEFARLKSHFSSLFTAFAFTKFLR